MDIRAGSAVEAAWKLLQCLLGRLEEGRQSKLHRAVAERLFSQGAYLPSWLVNSYKMVSNLISQFLLSVQGCSLGQERASVGSIWYVTFWYEGIY